VKTVGEDLNNIWLSRNTELNSFKPVKGGNLPSKYPFQRTQWHNHEKKVPEWGYFWEVSKMQRLMLLPCHCLI
jgi:hypothetical protein